MNGATISKIKDDCKTSDYLSVKYASFVLHTVVGYYINILKTTFNFNFNSNLKKGNTEKLFIKKVFR